MLPFLFCFAYCFTPQHCVRHTGVAPAALQLHCSRMVAVAMSVTKWCCNKTPVQVDVPHMHAAWLTPCSSEV
jgi:hypothetical protein